MRSIGEFFWSGKHIEEKVILAAVKGIDMTTAACVENAKQNHPWQNRTGTAEGSIQARGAVYTGVTVRGVWGSYGVFYFVYLELGTYKMPAMPCLRPAADQEYPKLPARMAAIYRAL